MPERADRLRHAGDRWRLFVVSGVANAVVLDTALNVFAFRVSNVLFSLVVGTVLLTLGAYGRFTGHLPDTSPYHGHATAGTGETPDRPVDPQTARALAEAERAMTEHAATPKQAAGVAAAAAYRSEEERSRAFAEATAASTPRTRRRVSGRCAERRVMSTTQGTRGIAQHDVQQYDAENARLNAITTTRAALLVGFVGLGALGTFWLNSRVQGHRAARQRQRRCPSRGHLLFGTDRRRLIPGPRPGHRC